VHPILFTIPGLGWPLHTYGVCIVMGFLLGMFVVHREAQRQGEYVEDVLDFAFWALLGGMAGARIVFIAVNWHQYFVTNFWDKVDVFGFTFNMPAFLVIWKGGLVFYGAALGGLIAFLLFARARKLPVLKLADILIVGLPLAQVFGRLGCTAAGCCWGDAMYHLDAAGQYVANIPFATRFPEGSLAYNSLLGAASKVPELAAHMRETHLTVPLFPSQLMESFGVGLVFLALLFVRSRKWFHGQVLLTYGILYPILRSTLEIFRGDPERGYVIPGVLSTSQFISLFVAAGSLITILVMRRRGLTSQHLQTP
jgi:phosphatidylglycerol:prolipoprotein diacylglycerol transferase